MYYALHIVNLIAHPRYTTPRPSAARGRFMRLYVLQFGLSGVARRFDPYRAHWDVPLVRYRLSGRPPCPCARRSPRRSPVLRHDLVADRVEHEKNAGQTACVPALLVLYCPRVVQFAVYHE